MWWKWRECGIVSDLDNKETEDSPDSKRFTFDYSFWSHDGFKVIRRLMSVVVEEAFLGRLSHWGLRSGRALIAIR